VCSGCYARACETYGLCPGCGTDRLLPGLNASRQPVCTDCAGGIGDFTCQRCGQEAWRQRKRVCARCVLREQLATALDDGTGSVRAELVPFLEHLCAMRRPRSGLLWLTKPHTIRLLTQLARGTVPLTHDGISTLTPHQAVIHLRDLLIAADVLPAVDKRAFLFEQWATRWLTTITDAEQRHTLDLYVRWHLQRRLNAAAETATRTDYRDQNARYRARQGAAFLAWLSTHHLTLATLDQATVDRWFARHPGQWQRAGVRQFLHWAIRTRHAPTLRVPPEQHRTGTILTQPQRLTLLRRVIEGDRLDPLEQVLITLTLLYAQPLARIVRLRTGDISHDHRGRTQLALGDPPIPVPSPFDAILTTYLAHRPNLTTATNRDSDWLFPGRRGGHPIHPTTVRLRLSRLGLTATACRGRALHELVTAAPPAIVAGMIGYASNTVEHTAKQAGGTWNRYAAIPRTGRTPPTGSTARRP
jgi:hypothetical protein